MRIAALKADEVVYAVGRDGRLPDSLDGWRRSDAGRDGAKEALLTIPKGGRYLIACFAKKGLAQSAVIAAYVQHEDPLYLYTERHAHGLRRLNDNDQDGDHACERCGATVEGAGYCCVQGSAFALCRSCALPGSKEQRRLAVDFSTGYLEEANATKDRTAALDVGGRRLWLSESVRFAGNGSRVLDEKLMAVAARALRSHPGLFIRCEAHSTGCGLECDGSAPCGNEKCRKLFGARGGAVGFSRAARRRGGAARGSGRGRRSGRVAAADGHEERAPRRVPPVCSIKARLRRCRCFPGPAARRATAVFTPHRPVPLRSL